MGIARTTTSAVGTRLNVITIRDVQRIPQHSVQAHAPRVYIDEHGALHEGYEWKVQDADGTLIEVVADTSQDIRAVGRHLGTHH